MIKAIMKIHTTSSSVTFVCGDVAIIGNGEFRASSGKVDGFILYADTLQYENGAKLSRDEQENVNRISTKRMFFFISYFLLRLYKNRFYWQ